jgi:D-alanine-D-alanine ligase
MRIRPRDGREDTFLYSLEVKRDWARLIDYEVPPRLPPPALAALADTARRAYRLLGCRDLARVDMRLAGDGRAVFLEANPLPGLSATTGDFVIALRQSGWSYRAIIERLLAEARGRFGRVPATLRSA